jgi:hypothetical protein
MALPQTHLLREDRKSRDVLFVPPSRVAGVVVEPRRRPRLAPGP